MSSDGGRPSSHDANPGAFVFILHICRPLLSQVLFWGGRSQGKDWQESVYALMDVCEVSHCADY